MRDGLTHIVFLLDRSGSMKELADDTISGYNEFIEKQKNEPGEAWLTTALFDDGYELLHDHEDICSIAPITTEQYFARGRTALYDAVGKAVDDTGAFLSSLAEAERPSKVLVVIITDGYENASRRYTREDIHARITHQTGRYSWQFLFLGANIDSQQEAGIIGISPDFAMDFIASPQGTARSFRRASAAASMARKHGHVILDWKTDEHSDE